MAELIAKIAAAKGDAPALIDEYGTTTWSELDDRVNRAVEAMRGLGLVTHDTIALMSGNRREFFEVFGAAAHGSWTVVPVNWHWVAEELAYVIENAEAKVMLVDDRFLDVAVAARADERTSGCTAWIVLGEHAGAELPEGFVAWEELLAAASGVSACRHRDGWADVLHVGHHRIPEGGSLDPVHHRDALRGPGADIAQLHRHALASGRRRDPVDRAGLPLRPVGVLGVPAAVGRDRW